MRHRSVQQRRRHDDRIDVPRATGRRSRQGSAAGKADALRPEYSHVTLHRAARWLCGNEPHCRGQWRSRTVTCGIQDEGCPLRHCPRQSLEILMNVSVHRAKTCLSASLATARRSERGLSTSDHKERDDHHAEESHGHDRPGRQIHHRLLHWYRAAVGSLAVCAEIRASCVEGSMFEGTRPATTRGMSFREMPMSSNCRSSRRWSAAAAWPRCQRCVARAIRAHNVARKPVRRDDAGWVPDRLNSDMIAAPFTVDRAARARMRRRRAWQRVRSREERAVAICSDCLLGSPEAANACVRAARG